MEYSKQKIINKPIPDFDSNGLIDRINVNTNLIITSVDVHVQIMHPYTGDLSIELAAPNGARKTLLSPSRVPGKDIIKHFNGDIMSNFLGQQAKGEWTIKVTDAGANDSGDLVSWTLSLNCKSDNQTEIFISDNQELSSAQICHHIGKIENISATVNIEHTHIGDLTCAIKSPSGKTVIIHDKVGGSKGSLTKTYNNETLGDFLGETAEGLWTLTIQDHLKGDSGKLKSWKLDIKTSTQ